MFTSGEEAGPDISHIFQKHCSLNKPYFLTVSEPRGDPQLGSSSSAYYFFDKEGKKTISIPKIKVKATEI